MSSSKTRLMIGAGAAALLFSVPVLAKVLASRTAPFNCVNAGGGNLKVQMAPGATDAGVPTGDWAAYNMTNVDMPVVCPVQLEFNTEAGRTVHDVQILASNTPAALSEIRCAYYLLDTLAGGGWTSPDMGMGLAGSLPVSRAPDHLVQVANATFTREFFYCTLPRTVGGAATGFLRGLEVRYDE